MEAELRDKIQNMRTGTPEFDGFFRTLALRTRNTSVTEIDKFVKSDELADLGPEYKRKRLAIQFFKGLETLGIGDFRIGRRGSATRFIWSVPMLEVAHTAVPNVSRSENASPGKTKSEAASRLIVVTHRYVLREDFTVTLDLPLDLIPSEADRLSAMIRTLPLERQQTGEKE